MQDDTQSQTSPIPKPLLGADTRPTDIGQIVRDHYDAVFRFCARRVGPDRAADAAQETFVTAHRALSKFRGESSVSTWLFGIANNECRRMVRRERIAPIQLDLDTAALSSTHLESEWVDRHTLSAALSKLSEEHRAVVLLHEFDGLTYDEAALLLGVPAGTVKSRLHHAFLNLRKMLYPEGDPR